MDVDVKFASLERQGIFGRRLVPALRRGAKKLLVQTFQERQQSVLRRRAEDEDAAALGRRETTIIEIVAIERDQRTAKLAREPVMLTVGRTPQVIVLEDEEHVPQQRLPHTTDEACGYVRIDVDTRLS